MCVTWFQINYCRACRAYIDSFVVGTVFCGQHDANQPCEPECAIGEIPVPGPCKTCQPPPVLRRSRRLWMRRLERGGEGPCYTDAIDEDTEEHTDDEAEADTDDDTSDYGGSEMDDQDGHDQKR